MEENGFRNVVNNSSKGSFRSSIFVPFISGVLGCSLVLGTCFGVPNIREKIVGGSNSTNPTSYENTGVVNNNLVSLSNYSDTAVYASSKILPSIVGISITYDVTTSNYFSMFGFGGGNSTTQATASGSGIIISEDGYIVTNNHVVSSESQSTYYEISEAKSIKIKLFNDETQYDATIVGKDSQTDLAVLKIEKSGLTAAEFADSDSVKVGEFAMAVGNPLDLGTTITCGVVSAVNRKVEDSEKTTAYTCIQTDAAINSGNSGGALVNSQGQVIGINTLKVSSTGVEGIGFAIPINSTTDVINQLKTYKKVKRPYIGISGRDLNEATAKRYNMVEGIYIVTVDEFSAAEKAGLKVGDVIIEADGKRIKTMNELNEIKNTHSIGDTMKLKIHRDGAEKEITLTLGEQS
ncbi:MAG TPA: hypothetical protein DEP51_01475 [Clostridiales bacterium]|nr:hypothetical protein [Clostridiales bacterium]